MQRQHPPNVLSEVDGNEWGDERKEYYENSQGNLNCVGPISDTF